MPPSQPSDCRSSELQGRKSEVELSFAVARRVRRSKGECLAVLDATVMPTTKAMTTKAVTVLREVHGEECVAVEAARV